MPPPRDYTPPARTGWIQANKRPSKPRQSILAPTPQPGTSALPTPPTGSTKNGSLRVHADSPPASTSKPRPRVTATKQTTLSFFPTPVTGERGKEQGKGGRLSFKEGRTALREKEARNSPSVGKGKGNERAEDEEKPPSKRRRLMEYDSDGEGDTSSPFLRPAPAPPRFLPSPSRRDRAAVAPNSPQPLRGPVSSPPEPSVPIATPTSPSSFARALADPRAKRELARMRAAALQEAEDESQRCSERLDRIKGKKLMVERHQKRRRAESMFPSISAILDADEDRRRGSFGASGPPSDTDEDEHDDEAEPQAGKSKKSLDALIADLMGYTDNFERDIMPRIKKTASGSDLLVPPPPRKSPARPRVPTQPLPRRDRGQDDDETQSAAQREAQEGPSLLARLLEAERQKDDRIPSSDVDENASELSTPPRVRTSTSRSRSRSRSLSFAPSPSPSPVCRSPSLACQPAAPPRRSPSLGSPPAPPLFSERRETEGEQPRREDGSDDLPPSFDVLAPPGWKTLSQSLSRPTGPTADEAENVFLSPSRGRSPPPPPPSRPRAAPRPADDNWISMSQRLDAPPAVLVAASQSLAPPPPVPAPATTSSPPPAESPSSFAADTYFKFPPREPRVYVHETQAEADLPEELEFDTMVSSAQRRRAAARLRERREAGELVRRAPGDKEEEAGAEGLGSYVEETQFGEEGPSAEGRRKEVRRRLEELRAADGAGDDGKDEEGGDERQRAVHFTPRGQEAFAGAEEGGEEEGEAEEREDAEMSGDDDVVESSQTQFFPALDSTPAPAKRSASPELSAAPVLADSAVSPDIPNDDDDDDIPTQPLPDSLAPASPARLQRSPTSSRIVLSSQSQFFLDLAPSRASAAKGWADLSSAWSGASPLPAPPKPPLRQAKLAFGGSAPVVHGYKRKHRPAEAPRDFAALEGDELSEEEDEDDVVPSSQTQAVSPLGKKQPQPLDFRPSAAVSPKAASTFRVPSAASRTGSASSLRRSVPSHRNGPSSRTTSGPSRSSSSGGGSGAWHSSSSSVIAPDSDLDVDVGWLTKRQQDIVDAPQAEEEESSSDERM